MKKLKIIQCSDSMLWYANLVGQEVPLLKEVDEGWLSEEPDGYTNIVRRSDAQVIEI